MVPTGFMKTNILIQNGKRLGRGGGFTSGRKFLPAYWFLTRFSLTLSLINWEDSLLPR